MFIVIKVLSNKISLYLYQQTGIEYDTNLTWVLDRREVDISNKGNIDMRLT